MDRLLLARLRERFTEVMQEECPWLGTSRVATVVDLATNGMKNLIEEECVLLISRPLKSVC